MKRTLKPTNSKSVNSTTGEKNVKTSNKKKGSENAPVKFRQPVDKQFVRSIVEDVEKVLHEGIPNTLPKSHTILQQIKSDLNELLNMLQQDFPLCINDYSLPNNPQIKTTDGPHNKNNHDKNNFQETIITTNQIIPQIKTINNSTIKSHPMQTKRVEELYQRNIKPTNLDERIAGMKSHLETYSCFSNNIISTSVSDTGVVSESNNVQQLTSFWNDRTKNDGQINHSIPKTFTDHIIDEIFTFRHKEKEHNQMVSKSSLSSLHSNLWQSTLPVDMHKSIFCTCDEECTSLYGKKYKNKEPVLKSVIPILKDMSTNTESTVNITQEKLNVINVSQDDGHIKIIIELIGDFTKNVSTSVNLEDENIERNNNVKEIGITVKQSTDNKLINRKTLLVSSEKPVTTDCDLNPTNEEFELEENCSQIKNDVDKHSDIFYDESPGKSSNATITRNKTEGMDYSDILFSTKPTDYCKDANELSQSSDIVSETEEMFVFGIEENNNDIDKTVYVGGGDSTFGQIQTQSSSLKVNLSICSDDNEEQSDFYVYPKTCNNNDTFNDNQLNRIEDKISKTTSTINVTQKILDSPIIPDLESLQEQTIIVDIGVSSKNESCKVKNNCSKHDLINFQINEKTLLVNDGIHQQVSSEMSQKESALSDKHNIISECFKTFSKELLQKEPNSSEKLCNEIDESAEIDHLIVPITKNNLTINRKHLKICQEMLHNTPSSDLNQSTLDTPLQISLEDHIFKHGLEYIWQTYQRGGFELISERDILALILCHAFKGKLKNNCLTEETSLFTEIYSKVLHFKSKTTNFITNCLNTIKKMLILINVRHILSNSSAETHCRSRFEHLSAKEVASFIYHSLISLSMVYIIEEELFGVFSNSKLVYPF